MINESAQVTLCYTAAMPRRSRYDLDAIRAASNLDCPHCHAVLNAAEYLRVDSERLRCSK